MILPMRALFSKCHTVSRHTPKWNLIYAHKKSNTLRAQIFAKRPKYITELSESPSYQIFNRIVKNYIKYGH
jgi:hypothetical protein